MLSRTADGNRVYFQAEAGHFLFPEVKRIFLKTLGAQVLLGEALQASPDIQVAFIYGSYAADEESMQSDIDLFVVGDADPRNLTTALSDFRDRTRREVNVYVIRAEEFRAAMKRLDGFLQNVMASPKVFIIGDENALQQIAA